jgi:hypothetical protein
MNNSVKRLTRLSRALHGLDKRLYQDFMRAIELLEECDKYEHDGDLDCRLKIFLSNTKSFWPIEEMR